MAPADIGNTPKYWIRPTQVLSAAPGFHRFVWDLHYAPPAGTSSQPGSYPISATPHDTPREPRGPWAIPGQYVVRLTVGGKSYTQPLTIRMDPRVKTPAAAIAKEHAMAMAPFDAIAFDSAAVGLAAGIRERLSAARQSAAGDPSRVAALRAAEDSLNAVVGQGVAGGGRRGGGGGRGRGGAGAAGPTLASMSGELQSLMTLLEEADAEPTTQAVAATESALRTHANLASRWRRITTVMIPALRM
jgi:hypothetical protein